MEKEKKNRISGRRTVKFKALVQHLEEERKVAEAKKTVIAAKVDQDTYDNEIHRVIDDIAKDVKITDESKETSVALDKDNNLTKPVEAEPEKVIPEKRYHFRLIFSALTLLTLLTAVFLVYDCFRRNKPIDEEKTIEESKFNQMDFELRSMWLNNRQINEDYIGQIVFDSRLIDLPIVQAKSVYKSDGSMYTFYSEEGELITDPIDHTGNDVYIWTDWKTFEYDPLGDGGSVFMDYRNSLNDQNLIVYGHHFARDYDPSGSKLFTPLDLLLTKDNYEDNKYLSLILDNEIRRYVVCNVFTISVNDEYEIQIIRTDLDKDLSGNAEPRFFSEFISYMNKISRYETGEMLHDGDHILTLITCLQHQPEYRQVIVCRQIEQIIYD